VNDIQRIGVALTELAACTNGTFDEAKSVAYLRRLREYDTEAVLGAIEHCARTSRFFPSVAEILDAMGGSPALQAAEAWAKRSRYSTDPATVETIRLLGGWDAIGRTHVDRMGFVERRFCELYPAVKAKMESQSPTPTLPGAPKMRRIGG
jgi:hypothetical protein